MTRLIDRLRLRLASLFARNRVDAALKKRDRAAPAGAGGREHRRRDEPRGRARDAAVRAFGPSALIEEQCRDTRRVAFFEHVAQDLRYTLRSLLRQPMLLAAAVVSIAVAVGANTTIFSLATS